MTTSRHHEKGQREYIPRMLRRTLLPCLLLASLVVTASAGARPPASMAKTCRLSPSEQGGSKPSTLGTTYVILLSAKGVSCTKAKRVVKDFNACRHKNGKAGHCSRVDGYKATEKRVQGTGQYDSRTTLKAGSKTISFTYTQFT